MNVDDTYRTIGDVSKLLNIKPHVLRFWEENFKQVSPLKRRGGRRLYSESDITLLRRIKELLYNEGYTVKGVQKYLSTKKTSTIKEEGKVIVSREVSLRLSEIKESLVKIKYFHKYDK